MKGIVQGQRRGPARIGRDAALSWALSGVMVALFLLALYALNRYGISSRAYVDRAYALSEPGLPVHSVRNARELYSLYRSMGVHGRVLVHLGRYLQFVEIEDRIVYGGRFRFPLSLFDVLRKYEERVNYKNVLWVGMQGNLFREIVNIVPPDVFQEKARTIDPRDSDVVAIGEDVIITHHWGSKRTIASRLPPVREPVLINIDASLFDRSDAPQQLIELLRSGLRSDLVTLNASEDNPDVTEVSRQRLRRFAETAFRDVVHEQ